MYPFCMGRPGWIYWMLICWSVAHSSKSLLVYSGPLSTRITAGLPRCWITRSSTRITRLLDKEVSTSMANASRLQSSITFNVRNFRPLTKLSDIKSMLQLVLIAAGCSNGCFTRWGSRRLPLRRLFIFN